MPSSHLHWGIKLDQERLGAVPPAHAAYGGRTQTSGHLDRRAEERRHLFREDRPPHSPPAASLTPAAACCFHRPNASTMTHGSTSRRSRPCPVDAEAAPAHTSATTPARIAAGSSTHAATTTARSGSVGGEVAPAAPSVGISPDAAAPEPDPKPASVLPLLCRAESGKCGFPDGFCESSDPIGVIAHHCRRFALARARRRNPCKARLGCVIGIVPSELCGQPCAEVVDVLAAGVGHDFSPEEVRVACGE